MGKWEKAAALAKSRGEEFVWPSKRSKVHRRKAAAKAKVLEAGPRAGNMEVVLDGKTPDEERPHCAHGPCLLFERYKAKGDVEAFWACAVYRDRKHCPFFLPFASAQKRRERKELRSSQPKRRPHLAALKRLKAFRQLKWQERSVCLQCSQLLLTKAEATKQHEGHKVQTGITKAQLRNPSQLLPSLSHKDKESQYWFANQTLSFLAKALEGAGFDACLCLGAPRLFERLNGSKSPIRPFLLDLDDRYKAFWGPRTFAHYSMFANHLYDPKLGGKCLDNFLRAAKKLAIFVDPPFGGLMGPLLHSLTALKARHAASRGTEDAETELFLVAPYFLEAKISEAAEAGLRMLDYQILYSNHPKFARSGGAERTPVRLFTSLSPAAIPLPESEGYRWCGECERHVSAKAKHCTKCSACVAKSGEAYRHRQRGCGVCVKAKYSHCARCSRCHLKEAPCRRPPKCSLCEAPASEHKRKDCPLRANLPHLL